MNSKVLVTTLIILLNYSISHASSAIELVCTNKSKNAKIQNLAIDVEAYESHNSYSINARPDYCFTIGNSITENQYSDMKSKSTAVSVSTKLNCTSSPMSPDTHNAVLSVSADLSEAAITTDKSQDLFECSEKSIFRKKIEDFIRGIGPEFGS